MVNLYRITIEGRAMFMEHSWSQYPTATGTRESVTAKLFPMPPRSIREWLAKRRSEGHIANALTPLHTWEVNLFNNVVLSPGMPFISNGPITYVFADRDVALLFKLSFAGNFAATVVYRDFGS